MITIDKSRINRELSRKKYAARQDRSQTQTRDQVRHRVGQMRRSYRRPEQTRLKEAERKKITAEIAKERDPEKLREKVNQAEKLGLTVSQKDAERLKKMEKATERLKENIRKMKSHQSSVTEKEAVRKMETGHTVQAMRELKENGMDGALGNEIATNSSDMAQNLKTLSKESGKHVDSIMQKKLRENSTPADTIHEQKRQDKADRNLEEKRQKDSTAKQMTVEQMKRLRGAAYGM